jgi:hypothetical protein
VHHNASARTQEHNQENIYDFRASQKGGKKLESQLIGEEGMSSLETSSKNFEAFGFETLRPPTNFKLGEQ